MNNNASSAQLALLLKRVSKIADELKLVAAELGQLAIVLKEAEAANAPSDKKSPSIKALAARQQAKKRIGRIKAEKSSKREQFRALLDSGLPKAKKRAPKSR